MFYHKNNFLNVCFELTISKKVRKRVKINQETMMKKCNIPKAELEIHAGHRDYFKNQLI